VKDYKVSPSQLKGKIAPPPSKSHTLRALLFSLMAEGDSTVRCALDSPDTDAMIAAIGQLGARVERSLGQIAIKGAAGRLTPADNVIECGNSGQVLRFIAAFAALLPTYTILSGDHSIRHNRPAQPLLTALSQLGALAASSRLDGYAPLIIKGVMQAGSCRLNGRDSQPVSALLMAAPFLSGTTRIAVDKPGEKPWIGLTLSWLKRLGISYENDNYERYQVQGGAQIKAFDFTVPSDFSSAAFPLVAALVTGSELTLENMDMDDVQGDKELIYALMRLGAQIEIDALSKKICVKKESKLQGGVVDINDFIDALPILAVAGCFGKKPLEIVGAGIARKKESDRVHAIATELKKMGAIIEEKEEGLLITPSPLKGAALFSHHDHRIAMALSVAALAADGPSLICDVECVAKSYTGFAAEFKKIGAKIEEVS
jgi:3-phosphoshikimate 1-carboxyvinyltransferase